MKMKCISKTESIVINCLTACDTSMSDIVSRKSMPKTGELYRMLLAPPSFVRASLT